MINKFLVCALVAPLVVLLSACESRTPADVMIHNVSIVDIETGTVNSGQAVIISDGTIVDVTSDQDMDRYRADQTIDGNSAYLIPALGDAHVHIQSRSELQNYLVHGVGLVVNMSGNPDHLKMRQEIISGQIEGPTILTVGPTLDGEPPTNPLFTSVNPDNASEVVGWIVSEGYDAIKIYQQMDANTLRAVIAASDEYKRVLTGHASRTAGISAAIESGQRYFAHGEELAFESFDEESRHYDLGQIPALADELNKAGVTTTPMLRYIEEIPLQVNDLEGFLKRPEMRVIPAAMHLSFDSRQGWFSNREDPAGFTGQIKSLAQFVAALTTALQQRNADLILGTDAGFGGAIPGHSVHMELETLVKAGLTEQQALLTATVEIGKYLNKIDPDAQPWGKIKAGHAADLLLIGGNPLTDISSTQDIKGFMLRGRWLERHALDETSNQLAKRQQTLLPLARNFEHALVTGDLEAARAAIDAIPQEYGKESLISADNCIFLGYRHYYGGKRPLAGQFYELCAQQHPDSSPLWIYIARAYASEGNIESAIASYSKAQALNPWYGNPQQAIDELSGN